MSRAMPSPLSIASWYMRAAAGRQVRGPIMDAEQFDEEVVRAVAHHEDAVFGAEPLVPGNGRELEPEAIVCAGRLFERLYGYDNMV